MRIERVTVRHHKACQVMPNSYPEWRNFQFTPNCHDWFFFLHTLPWTIAFKLEYVLFYQFYAIITTFWIKNCLVWHMCTTFMVKHLAENDVECWPRNVIKDFVISCMGLSDTPLYKTKWASSWDYDTYHIGEQWRLRRDHASVQSRQSLRCSHT